jgi:hypothetical protein
VALASVPVGLGVRVRHYCTKVGFEHVKRFTVRNAMWRDYSTLSVLDGRTYLNWTCW